MLRWKEPAEDGGAPIEQYRVDVCAQGLAEEHFSFTTPSLGVIVTGLRGNSYYAVRVSAENSGGASRSTEIIARTGAVAPGAPRPPSCAGDPQATEVTLVWRPPNDDGGSEVLGYTLRGQTYGDGNGGASEVVCALDTSGSRGVVEGLEPSRRYRFRVQARNVVGTGLLSEWSPVVLTAPPPPAAPSMPFVLSATSQTISVFWSDVCWGDDEEEDMSPMEFEVKISRSRVDEDGIPQSPVYTPGKVQRVLGPPVQFKGLRMFTAYVVCVRARGGGGWSEWSEASEPQSTSSQWSKEEIVDVLMQRHGNTLGGVFRSFDRDCDGFISPEDFITGLDRAGLESVSDEMKLELFHEADEVERGCITLREFTKCLGHAAAEAAKTARLLAESSRKSLQRSASGAGSIGSGGRELEAAGSLSPTVGRRSRAPISRPWRQNAASLSPPPRSLSPQASAPNLRRGRGVADLAGARPPLRRGASARALRPSASAKVFSLHLQGVRSQTCFTPPELRSGTGECASPPAGDLDPVSVTVSASSCRPTAAERHKEAEEAAMAERRKETYSGAGRPRICRPPAAQGPVNKSRSQRMLQPR